MASDKRVEWIVPTTGAKTLPVIEILTGRGFITGKSGSGKSNSASVIAEELLEANYNLLIIDPEGEYHGLKEKYEVLHVGNSELSDVRVTVDHADQLAEIALERNMPVILDVSDYLDGDKAQDLITNVVRALFQKEKSAQKPFLLMIEEMQEYLPQQGGNNELSELLERVAKRGRKRGLGMLGMSQRPSSVDKDFITQCDWMVWHRLSWQNDLEVVKKVLGTEKAAAVENLDTGEGFLMTDWDEAVERVQFKRKQTHDAGATPGLESYERPNLKSTSQDLVREIERTTTPGAPQETGEEQNPQSQDLNDAVGIIENSTESDLATSADGQLEIAGNEDLDSEELQRTVDEYQFDGELDKLDDPELREQIESLQRRNQVLSDEVVELRAILSSVESQPTGNHQNNTDSFTDAVSVGEDTGTQSEAPPKPLPPKPPVDRTGAAGNLMEFVAMILFLFRSLTYRFRLFWYRIRWGHDASDAA